MARKSKQVRDSTSKGRPQSSEQPAARSRASLTVAAVLLALVGLVIQQLFYSQSDARIVKGPSETHVRDAQDRDPSSQPPFTGAAIPNPDLSQLQPTNADRIRDARAAVAANPTSPGAWAQLGASCDAYGVYDCAAKGYRRAYELAPSDLRWLYLHAVARQAQGAGLNELLPLYGNVAAGMPRFAPVLYRTGEVLQANGKLAKAKDAYMRAIGLNPLDPSYQFAAGKVMLAMGDVERATQHLLAAAEFAPTDRLVRDTLAQALLRAGDKEKAAEIAEEARSLGATLELNDPLRAAALENATSPRAIFARASALISAGRYADAIENLEKIEETRPADPLVQIRLAYAHLKNGKLTQAETHFAAELSLRKALVEGKTDDTDLSNELGRIDAATVDYWTEYLAAMVQKNDTNALEKSLAEFAAAAPELPLHASAYAAWGDALKHAGRPDEAIEQYLKAIKLDPRFVAAYHNAALILEEFGHANEALTFYKRAAALQPSGPSAARLAVLKKAPPESRKKSKTPSDPE